MKDDKSADIYVSIDDICDLGREQGSQTFQVFTEEGREEMATLISVVEIDGKEYAVYSIPHRQNSDLVEILSSYVVKDEEGYDELRDIEDPKDKKKITEFILKLTGSGSSRQEKKKP